MLPRLRSHVRHNVVGYIALFVALSGTAYAAKPMITGADIENGSITDADIATANKDGTAATPSLRTLGTGAQQAAAGNDSRLSDARTPTGVAGGDLSGSYPNPRIEEGSVEPLDFARNIPATKVLSTSSESIADNTFTALSPVGEAYDVTNAHDQLTNPSRLTVPVGGIYRVAITVLWQQSDLDGVRQLDLRLNGGATNDLDVISGTAAVTQHFSTEIQLAGGDYVEVRAAQNSGSTLLVQVNAFTISWIAPG
jgi:hypothetical protein